MSILGLPQRNEIQNSVLAAPAPAAAEAVDEQLWFCCTICCNFGLLEISGDLR